MVNVRYLVAGGLAVVAHGYLRFTADVDLIVDLEPANVTRAVAALESLYSGTATKPISASGCPGYLSQRS